MLIFILCLITIGVWCMRGGAATIAAFCVVDDEDLWLAVALIYLWRGRGASINRQIHSINYKSKVSTPPAMTMNLNALLLLVTLLATVSSLSVQPKRWINNGPSRQPRRSVSYRPHHRSWWETSTLLLEGRRHASTSPCTISNEHCYASSPIREPRSDKRSTIMHKYHSNDETATSHNSLLRSLALVATCRRLSFLIVSMALVNFVRSSILKVSIYQCKQRTIVISNIMKKNRALKESNNFVTLMLFL